MTDEELTALRSWYVNEKASWTRAHDVQLMPSYPWVRYFDALLAELDRLRAENAALLQTHRGDQALRNLELAVENAALREIAQAVAKANVWTHGVPKIGIDVPMLYSVFDDLQETRTRARALLEGASRE